MKILLTNNHLSTFGGSESFTLTLYNVLKRKGHEVHVYSPHAESGGMSDYFDSIFITPPPFHYDLALVNHNTCLLEVKKHTPVDHIRFISHGVYPALEQPLPIADSYVAVSEEIRLHLKRKGYNKVMVINNPIDLTEFRPVKQLRHDPESLFVMCQGIEAQDKVSELGFSIDFISPNRYTRKRLYHSNFNIHDGVVGLGRSAFEGLACGRPVIVYDQRSYNVDGRYDGVITEKNISELLKNNCSGRRYNRQFDAETVRTEFLESYVPDTEYYRSIAEKYFDAEKIVEQLIEH